MFPRFRITEANSTEAIGTLTATTCVSENWVGGGWLGYLMVNAQQLTRGRWHARGNLWGFEPECSTAIQLLRPDSTWPATQATRELE
ncbi:MAG TPA: hypothetical protein VFM10_05435 [Terriglobales bacterium]|jgi:hypothetical protein|nr:hypothetical protein [Terriglobales bacterium]